MLRRKLTPLQKQLLKWSKFWLEEKDPRKKAFYLKNLLKINVFVDKEKQRD